MILREWFLKLLQKLIDIMIQIKKVSCKNLNDQQLSECVFHLADAIHNILEEG